MSGGVQVKGLKHGRRGWVLVVERLVRVDNDYYRPRRTLVEGEDAIVDAVTECGGRELAESALQAMASTQGEFRVQGNRFERPPVEVPAARRRAKPRNNSEIVRLRARCERLEETVHALERQLKRVAKEPAQNDEPGVDGAESVAPVSPRVAKTGPESGEPDALSAEVSSEVADAPRHAAPDRSGRVPDAQGAGDEDVDSPRRAAPDMSRQSAQDSDEPAVVDEPSAQDSDEPAAVHDAPAQDSEEPAAASSDADSTALPGSKPSSDRPEDGAGRTEAALRFPTLEDLASAAGGVMGETVEFSSDSSAGLHEGAWWVAELMAEEEVPLGAIVVDRQALTRLGGTLMMMDAAAIEAMDGEPLNPDMVDAMNEILKAQARGFNQIDGNPHVRMSQLRSFEAERDAWVGEAPNPLAFLDHFGGRWRLVSRALQ